MDVLCETLVEKECLAHLKVIQMLQQCFQLSLKHSMEMLDLITQGVSHFSELLDALDEELQFLEQLFQNLNVLVVDGLMQQVVETEPARNNQHQTFIQFSRDVK